MKSTLKITAKGQVTLKKQLLDHLGVRPGDKITAEVTGDGRVEVRAATPTEGDLNGFFGCLSHKGETPLTIEEMNEIIKRGWAGEL